jgi:N-acetylglucosamine-6-phosphate deacetylase
MYALKGNIVTADSLLSGGAVVVRDGVIAGVYKNTEQLPEVQRIYDFGGSLIAPGFVDIHCHGSRRVMVNEDPGAVAAYHYKRGTTSMLLSLYRDLSRAEILDALARIGAEMKSAPNIMGVHMEGPYLNPSLGSKGKKSVVIDKAEYRAVIDSGLVKQWTFAPEIEGAAAFCREIAGKGIVPAIGHSAASPAEVADAVKNGARIVTHLMDATGSSIDPTRYPGTKEVDFDAACLLEDGLYYEVINDREGIHVRPEMVKLIIKTAGIDKVVGITDCYAGQDADADRDDGADINFYKGELTGSKLTMDGVARNFLRLGLSVCEVFKVTALNPARALGVADTVGQIKAGCRANILIADAELNKIEVFTPQNDGLK